MTHQPTQRFDGGCGREDDPVALPLALPYANPSGGQVQILDLQIQGFADAQASVGFLNTLLQPTMSSTGVVRGQNDGLCKAWQGNL